LKVAIFTESGAGFGLGHISRMRSLARSLKEYGAEVDFAPNREYRAEFAKDRGIAVVDSYSAAKDDYMKILDVTGLLVSFDDYNRIAYPEGIVVNAAIDAECLGYPQSDGLSYLLGSDYAMVRDGFSGDKKRIKEKMEKILLIFGRDDSSQSCKVVLRVLVDKFPQLTKVIIVGSGFGDVDLLEDIADNNTEFIFDPHADILCKAMDDCDCAISSGGQTLHELATRGVPTIGVCTTGNQLANIKGLAKAAFLDYAANFDDKDLGKRIEDAVVKMMSADKRKTSSAIGHRLIDGKGSKRLARSILSYAHRKKLSLRNAVFGDAQNIFNLANEEQVRANSFHPEPISWEDHLKWFENKLSDEKSLFLVIEEGGNFCGQLRFDLDKSRDTIGISLAAPLRGLGLGSFILKKALKDLNMSNSIVAYVKDSNIASIKTFEAAGFSFVKNVDNCDCLSREYIYEK